MYLQDNTGGNRSRNKRPRRAASGSVPAVKALLALIIFLAANILFFALTCPFVVWFGPFHNIKTAALGAIGTSEHSYLLRYIGMSQQEINKLSRQVNRPRRRYNRSHRQ